MRTNPAVFRSSSIPKVLKAQNVKFPVDAYCCTYFTLSRNSSSLAQAPSRSSQLSLIYFQEGDVHDNQVPESSTVGYIQDLIPSPVLTLLCSGRDLLKVL